MQRRNDTSTAGRADSPFSSPALSLRASFFRLLPRPGSLGFMANHHPPKITCLGSSKDLVSDRSPGLALVLQVYCIGPPTFFNTRSVYSHSGLSVAGSIHEGDHSALSVGGIKAVFATGVTSPIAVIFCSVPPPDCRDKGFKGLQPVTDPNCHRNI